MLSVKPMDTKRIWTSLPISKQNFSKRLPIHCEFAFLTNYATRN